MPAKTFYVKNATASGSNFGSLQDGGTLTTATTGTGWTVGTTAATAYSPIVYATKQAAGTFGAVALPSGAPSSAAADAWRTETPLTGTFSTGTWTFAASVIAVAAAASGAGKLRVRLWKDTSATGATASEITTSTVTTGQWTNLLTSASQNLSGTQSISSFTLSNEYLFVQMACQIDTASASASGDVVVRVDTTNSRIVTPSFTAALSATTATSSASTSTRTISGSKTAASAGPVTQQRYFQMRGWYASGGVFESWVTAGAPSTSAPSGHTLSDVIVVASWLA